MSKKLIEKEVSSKIPFSKSPTKVIVVFLVLTFTLTYLLNLIMWLNYEIIEENLLLLSLGTRVQMIIPAFSAIILNLFIFKTKDYSRKSKILFSYFIVLCALFAVVFVLWLVNPIDITSIQLESIENLGLIVVMSVLNLSILLLILGWLALVFYWNLKSDSRKELKAAKLSFGKPSYYLLFTLFFFGYFLLSTILNWGFNLGSPPSEPVELSELLIGLAALIFGPIISFPALFGEEYGWRIFLQDGLAKKYNRFKAVLLVGLVWSLWHVPLILLQGVFSHYLIFGFFVYTLSTIIISILFGLAVFKTKSVWIAAYLHGLSATPNILAAYFYNPSDPLISFGLGIYGLPILAVIAIVFLRAKEWKEKDN